MIIIEKIVNPINKIKMIKNLMNKNNNINEFVKKLIQYKKILQHKLINMLQVKIIMKAVKKYFIAGKCSIIKKIMIM